jgi:hypothetical protein
MTKVKSKVLRTDTFYGIKVATISSPNGLCWLAREVDNALCYTISGFNFYDVIHQCFLKFQRGEGYEILKRGDFDDESRKLDIIANHPNHLVFYWPGLEFVCELVDKNRGESGKYAN